MRKRVLGTRSRRARGGLGLRRRPAPGAAPGTMQLDPEGRPPRIRVIGYGPDAIEEHEVATTAELAPLLSRHPVTWVNVDGLGDAATITEIGRLFGLHTLALEDVVHTPQRAKAEDHEDHLFVIVQMAHTNGRPGAGDGAGAGGNDGGAGGANHATASGLGDAPGARLEQLSMFIGNGFVVTFQESPPGDCFDGVRTRLRQGRQKIRCSAADYLGYALLDTAIDSVNPLLEALSDRLTELEADVLVRTDRGMAEAIQAAKREIHLLTRTTFPVREAVLRLQRDDSGLVSDETKVYLRDCYDHTLQTNEALQAARDLAADLMAMHQATLSNRLNDVIKFLTILSTIFIPLSFIAGLYGMNFDGTASRWNMPELRWRYGYPFAIVIMMAVAGAMLTFFRRKGWLKSDE